MATHAVDAGRRSELARWLLHGVIGGVVAGLVFAMFEMLMAVALMGADAFFMPLRMIGGIALGEQALASDTSLVVAGGAGMAVHMMLSAMFGAVIGLGAAVVPALRRAALALVAWASVAGFGLWIVNFYVIAPIAGWHWFPNDTNPVVQFFAHTFFYGSLLGLYLNAFVRARR